MHSSKLLTESFLFRGGSHQWGLLLLPLLTGAHFTKGSVWEVNICCGHETTQDFSHLVHRLVAGVVYLGFDG